MPGLTRGNRISQHPTPTGLANCQSTTPVRGHFTSLHFTGMRVAAGIQPACQSPAQHLSVVLTVVGPTWSCGVSALLTWPLHSIAIQRPPFLLASMFRAFSPSRLFHGVVLCHAECVCLQCMQFESQSGVCWQTSRASVLTFSVFASELRAHVRAPPRSSSTGGHGCELRCVGAAVARCVLQSRPSQPSLACDNNSRDLSHLRTVLPLQVVSEV